MTSYDPASRRPVAARQSGWARALAGSLGRLGVRPNQVSLLSLVFAGLGGGAIPLASRSPMPWHAVLFVLAAGFIQLRLLCNLLDGLIAVEGGRATRRGPVFNELPDRLSDATVLVCAGYMLGGVAWLNALGWTAALLAVLTAYVRALAGSLGAGQDFGGPMAKQRRMEIVSAACLIDAVLTAREPGIWVMAAALAIVAAGSALTVARRTLRLVQELESA